MPPRNRLAQLGLLAAVALTTGACETYYNRVPSPDDLMHAVPWFDHMIRQRYVHPYSRADIPRNTVAGTVPIGGGEADWIAEWRTGNAATADRLVNPLRGNVAAPADSAPRGTGQARRPGPAVAHLPASIAARGDSSYQNFCAVCHGGSGAADAPMSRQVGAPSLLTPRARAYSDGYIYSIIRYGRGVMPRYGDKVYRPDDRWAIVNHVRALQANAGGADSAPATAPAATAPAPAAGATR
jgi:mono/diheme cytochrome c family protein